MSLKILSTMVLASGLVMAQTVAPEQRQEPMGTQPGAEQQQQPLGTTQENQRTDVTAGAEMNTQAADRRWQEGEVNNFRVCIERGGNDFVARDANNITFALSGQTEQLGDYVGGTVEITGRINDPQKVGIGAYPAFNPVLVVENVRQVSQSCELEAQRQVGATATTDEHLRAEDRTDVDAQAQVGTTDTQAGVDAQAQVGTTDTQATTTDPMAADQQRTDTLTTDQQMETETARVEEDREHIGDDLQAAGREIEDTTRDAGAAVADTTRDAARETEQAFTEQETERTDAYATTDADRDAQRTDAFATQDQDAVATDTQRDAFAADDARADQDRDTMARADFDDEAALPQTASPLPLLALLGFGLMGAGLVSRRRK